MAVKDTQNRTIVLNIKEENYTKFLSDSNVAHDAIKAHYIQSPELFPISMSKGYVLNGKTRVSSKMNIQMRKIKVDGITYQIRPSFILPYLRAKTEEASKGLFLLRFGVPFWALAFVFGRNPMWWYRLYLSFSENSIVGTTIKKPEDLPEDLIGDEQHIKVRGEKAYTATTVAENCFLGVAVCEKADEKSLAEGYGVFKEEAADLKPDYQAKTVNTDGWSATQNAWQAIYPCISVVECFLHAFLKVRDRATKSQEEHFQIAADKIWECYRADSKQSMSQRLRRLREWTEKTVPDSPMKKNILKLCKKKERWLKHFKYPNAHRTSNMLDRLMRATSKHAFNSQMFHGKTLKNTTQNFRAFALLYNFSPSCSAAQDQANKLASPAARLNGFTYHEDWLQNLLISASLGGFRHHSKTL